MYSEVPVSLSEIIENIKISPLTKIIADVGIIFGIVFTGINIYIKYPQLIFWILIFIIIIWIVHAQLLNYGKKICKKQKLDEDIDLDSISDTDFFEDK